MAEGQESGSVICVVDDDLSFGETASEFLHWLGYETKVFTSARGFLDWYKESWQKCGAIISDVTMPEMSGYELCKRVRSQAALERVPIILITGNDPATEKVTGLEAGADEFLPKPVPMRELIAKLASLLRIRAREHQKFEQLARFIPPNIVSLLAGGDAQSLIKPHRSEVSVVFIDLRGFTAFTEKTEPEDVLRTLSDFYLAVGGATIKYNGTLGHLAGDGVMVFFNDPQPNQKHHEYAVRMALEVRKSLSEQRKAWRERHYQIDFGIGLSEGYTTIGGIGFERFWQYTVIGSAPNFASRLCKVADQGQILASHRFLARLGEGVCQTESLGQLSLKGIERPIVVHNILSIQDDS